MFYKTRFLLSLLVLCTALAACGDNDNDAPQTTSPEATEQQTATTTAVSTTKIEAGMSEKAVTDLLGAPAFIQTRTIDTLTITHSEWTDEAGTTSVQFQNGKVQFSQFTPSNK
mgnify:CR=1 FL=1|tara:strand:+ start:191 stop:529 length:339 start_codon:yes stop_codon:yes gene_type:complete